MVDEADLRTKLQLDTAEFGKSLNQATSLVSGSASRWARMFSAPSLAIAGLGAAAVLGFRRMSQAAREFEFRAREAYTQVDQTRISFQRMSSDILNFARTTGFSVKDTTEAWYEAVSAGQDAANMTKFMRGAAELATAGYVELAQAVDVLTTAVNVYGKENLSVSRAADVLLTTVRLGKTRMDELASSMGIVLPIAHQMGLSIEEVGAALAVATARGIKTEMAVTSLRALLMELANPIDEVAQKTDQVGLDWTAAGVRAYGLEGMMRRLNRTLSDTPLALTDVIREARSLTLTAILASDEGLASLSAAFEAMGKSAGYAATQTKEVRKTLEWQKRAAMAEWQVSMIDAGEALKGVDATLTKLSATLARQTQLWKGFAGALSLVFKPVENALDAMEGKGPELVRAQTPFWSTMSEGMTGGAEALQKRLRQDRESYLSTWKQLTEAEILVGPTERFADTLRQLIRQERESTLALRQQFTETAWQRGGDQWRPPDVSERLYAGAARVLAMEDYLADLTQTVRAETAAQTEVWDMAAEAQTQTQRDRLAAVRDAQAKIERGERALAAQLLDVATNVLPNATKVWKGEYEHRKRIVQNALDDIERIEKERARTREAAQARVFEWGLEGKSERKRQGAYAGRARETMGTAEGAYQRGNLGEAERQIRRALEMQERAVELAQGGRRKGAIAEYERMAAALDQVMARQAGALRDEVADQQAAMQQLVDKSQALRQNFAAAAKAFAGGDLERSKAILTMIVQQTQSFQQLAAQPVSVEVHSEGAVQTLKALKDKLVELQGFGLSIEVKRIKWAEEGEKKAAGGWARRQHGGYVTGPFGIPVDYVPPWSGSNYGSLYAGSGRDRVPALLEPGEFVVNARSAGLYGSLLERINAAQGRRVAVPGSGGGPSIIINLTTSRVTPEFVRDQLGPMLRRELSRGRVKSLA